MKNYSLKDAFKALDEIEDSIVDVSSVRESFIKEENGEGVKKVVFIIKDEFDLDTENRIDDIAAEFECQSYMPDVGIMEISGHESLVDKCKEAILSELGEKVELNESKLKEGYLGQTLRDFLDACIDAGTIDEIVLSDIDCDDFTVIFRGKLDDIPDDLLDCEYADFDCGGDKIVVNVGEDSYDTYYDTLESFLEDYNGDEVEIAQENYGGFDTVFTGDKSDAIDEFGEEGFQNFDAPKYICINIHANCEHEPLPECKKEELHENKSFSLTDDKEVVEAKEYLDNSQKTEQEEVVVNIDADTVDQLAKDNVGSFVFTCTNCGCEVLRTLDQLKDIGYERQEDGTFKLKDPDDNAEYITCPECHNSETFNGNKRIEAADVDAEVNGEAEPANTETNAEAGVVPEETEVEEETFGESLEEGKKPRKAGKYIFFGVDDKGDTVEKVEYEFNSGKIKDLKDNRDKLFDNDKVVTVYVSIVDEKGKEKPLDIYTIDREELSESLKEWDDEPGEPIYDDGSWKKDAWRFVYKLKGEDEEHVDHKDYGDWETGFTFKDDKEMEDTFDYWYFVDIRNPNWGPFASFPNPLPKEINIIKEALEEEPKLETFDEQMDFLAKDEQEAIEGYEKVIGLVEDEHVKEQLSIILGEEKAHKKFLEDVKGDHSLEYVDPGHEEAEEIEVELEEKLTWDKVEQALWSKQYNGPVHSEINYGCLRGFESRLDAAQAADFIEKKFKVECDVERDPFDNNGWVVKVPSVVDESLKEGFKKIEKGQTFWSKDGEEWEECTKEEFDECGYEDVSEPEKDEALKEEYDEFSVTDIDEETLDKAICEHLDSMFENFGSYKTETAILRDVENKIILEGVLTFKNNKVQDTRLVLEAIDYDSNSGSLKFSLTSPDFENMSGNLNTVLKEGLVTSTTFDNINEVLEESKEIEKVIRFFNNENEEEWIDIRMFGDDWEVADVSHGEIIGKDHTKVEDTEYIVHLSEDNDGQFLKLYSLDKENGEEQKGFGFVFESKQSCNEGPLEEGSKNKHKFEVLWYEGPTEEEAMKGDYQTKEFDSKDEALEFYNSIKDDEGKFGFWVTERDADWEVVDNLIG